MKSPLPPHSSVQLQAMCVLALPVSQFVVSVTESPDCALTVYLLSLPCCCDQWKLYVSSPACSWHYLAGVAFNQSVAEILLLCSLHGLCRTLIPRIPYVKRRRRRHTAFPRANYPRSGATAWRARECRPIAGVCTRHQTDSVGRPLLCLPTQG